MTFMLLRRFSTLKSVLYIHLVFRPRSFSSRNASVLGTEIAATQPSSLNHARITSANYSRSLPLSPLFSDSNAALEDPEIELVDNETWRVSSGLAEVWRGRSEVSETKGAFPEKDDEVMNYVPPDKEYPDFDEIEDMRIRRNLFYKIDRDSREFEECSFDFHRRKSSKNKGGRTESKKKENPSRNMNSEVEKSSRNKEEVKENRKKGSLKNLSPLEKERLLKVCKSGHLIPSLHETDSSTIERKQRTPTFNQLTAPYHEPFCLDIYISKGSVRACIIHRATSKVVVVAHSISKDLKYDLRSTKNKAACVAVGEVLARRALADDIYNVVYTPRKGEKLEGKLQIVLQSIIDNGVDVKVKIKKRKPKKTCHILG